jgi:hypothetical protein
LKSEQLLFQEIQGRHTGKNMAEILGSALDRFKLHDKVIVLTFLHISVSLNYCVLLQVRWFTSDGAAVNHTALCMLENTLMNTG